MTRPRWTTPKPTERGQMAAYIAKFCIFAMTAVLIVSVGAAQGQVLKTEPGDGALPSGKKVLVDDGTCPAGQIKEVTGGSKVAHIARSTRCIPHGGAK